MGQGHAGTRDSLCRTGFQPRSHSGVTHIVGPLEPSAQQTNLVWANRVFTTKSDFETWLASRGSNYELSVAASSRCGTSLRCRFSITCRKRVGAGLEASVAHGAADHDHLLQRPSRHAGFTGARAFRQVPLGAATGRSSLAGTTLDDGRRGWLAEVTPGRESNSQDARCPPRLAKGLCRSGPPRPIRSRPDRLLPEIELAPCAVLPPEGGLLRNGGGPLLRDWRVGGDLPAVDLRRARIVRLGRLRRSHCHDEREERIVSFELARRQFLRRHTNEEGDGCEHIPSLPDGNVVRGEDVAEQP